MDDGNTPLSFTHLATNLRGWRKCRGLTQPELARTSGVSASYISKIETGQHLEVRIETVRKLAIALRVQTTTLTPQRADWGPESPGAARTSRRVRKPHGLRAWLGQL
ncbi:helix-turn-helix domain-containing protein [Microbispora bryophytorum]|uniref:helix-turn-helix domain-containing protein n=1 Tax=Microbispora bryophytorum TaxID=1460882 RepID=UPI0033CD40B0